ncbi:MAG: hypothetical protein ACLR23_02225 [Clostridia bacterium]
MDKVGMSPREVTNRFVAESAISIPGAVKLAESVEDTIWEDLFIDGNTAEYCKRALVAYKRSRRSNPGVIWPRWIPLSCLNLL